MGLVHRYPVTAAIALAAVALTVGFFVVARPVYHAPGQSKPVNIPNQPPAADRAGAAGWVWPDTPPGWEAGYSISGLNVSGLQPVELARAQLAAALAVLDSSKVRVLTAMRPNRNGVIAILAAPTLDGTPVKTCLAALLQGTAPVVWECPGATPSHSDLGNSRVFVAAIRLAWPMTDGTVQRPLYLVGVARGDVQRVELHTARFGTQTLYTRGETWGQFEVADGDPGNSARLKVFGRHGLVETLPLRVGSGSQKIFR